ncbi:MAG: hypothetical protein ACK5XN_33035, partial [Bacteroidota bacterium]
IKRRSLSGKVSVSPFSGVTRGTLGGIVFRHSIFEQQDTTNDQRFSEMIYVSRETYSQKGVSFI